MKFCVRVAVTPVVLQVKPVNLPVKNPPYILFVSLPVKLPILTGQRHFIFTVFK